MSENEMNRAIAFFLGIALVNCNLSGIKKKDDSNGKRDAAFFVFGPGKGCFPGSATVVTPGGRKRLDELEIGDQVQDRSKSGQKLWTTVHSFQNFHNFVEKDYIKINLGGGRRSVSMSSNHYLYRQNANGRAETVEAGFIEIGDILFLTSGLARVTSIETVTDQGAIAPLTESGSMIVNGVWVSSFGNTLEQ